MRKITDGQGAGIIVEVGGAGTIAQSTLAVAHRVTISLIGHIAYDTTGMNLLHFTCSGATLRAIGGGSRTDLDDMNRVVPAHRLRPAWAAAPTSARSPAVTETRKVVPCGSWETGRTGRTAWTCR
ncbi:hypothetical protein [Streptomyces sp. HO565]|uniref:hypothetical protein n=1 Tax=Streptomyces sp. HO565 TaxID=2857489 RepID=UPI0034DBB1F3